MSKSKAAKALRERSMGLIITTWVSSVVSLGLLYLAGTAVDADLSSFRSCGTNSSGLSVSSCGKQSLNPGDLLLLVLFVLCACLMVTLFTAAWRMTRRSVG